MPIKHPSFHVEIRNMGVTLLERIKRRHLHDSGGTLSKFYFETLMLYCIEMTLNTPDFSYQEEDGKLVHIKHFPFGVGYPGDPQTGSR